MNSSLNSDHEEPKNLRVSFDLQSSDGESSAMSESGERCVDSLSPHRLSLLNLVQVAKLRIDKIEFFSNSSITGILERLTQSTSDVVGQRSTSKSKPPKAIKPNTDLTQMFFIEYQFPVVNSSIAATQVMRAPAKRVRLEDDIVYFEHSADYSVLFNSNSLETWWRSGVVFKLFARAKAGPTLIASARLRLRNVLNSRNFKLYKKLAVSEPTEPTPKRSGTLHVTLELASDLSDFAADLAKLKTIESKSSRSKPIARPERKTEAIQLPLKTTPSLSEEISFPIQLYLSISDARGFNHLPASVNAKEAVYLVCRLFWNKEMVKFDSPLDSTYSSWSVNLSFLIKPSIIEHMRNNFMIIEAWKKADDSLLGTIKLPLHEFHLKFKDIPSLKEYLEDFNRFSLPMTGVNGWLAACDPFSGKKVGEINVLLAMGSASQVLNLQKVLFDTTRVKSTKPSQVNVCFVDHRVTFILDELKVAGEERDIYVKYFFPSKEIKSAEKLKLCPFLMGPIANVNFENRVEHLFKISKSEELASLLGKVFVGAHGIQENVGLEFEIWTRSYFPSMREVMVAKGELDLDKLFHVFRAKIADRSFLIQLEPTANEKFSGHMCLTVEYESSDFLPSTKSELEQMSEGSSVCLIVGVLQASGLQQAISGAATRSGLRLADLQSAEIFVKFSLAFLNKPQVN